MTSASAVKYGGVVESLACYLWKNYIGAEVTLPELKSFDSSILGVCLHISSEEIASREDWINSKADFTLTQRCVKLDGHKLDSVSRDTLRSLPNREFTSERTRRSTPAGVSDGL